MKTIKTLALALFITITSSCQKKENNKMNTQNTEPEFEGEATLCSPFGFPMEVYKGHIGGGTLTIGLETGVQGWGSSGSGIGNGAKPLPKELSCIWVSYAEDCMYSIDCPVDYDKLVAVFEEGYQSSVKKLGYKKITYNAIIVGFAPGGVVVVWASGPGRTVEIGRYQGKKYVVPQEEIDKLDASGRTIFDPKFRKMIMTSPNIIPIEMQNNPKPIPYGLWDSYRTRYNWRPVVEVQNEAIILDVSFDMFNGEKEALFDKTLIENKFEKRGILSGIGIGWRDTKGQGYGGLIYFNEEEIRNAFKKMYKDIPDAESELVFTVNHANNFITVLLKCGDKKIRFIKNNVEVFKSRKNSLNN